MDNQAYNRRSLIGGGVLAAGLAAMAQPAAARSQEEAWRPAREPQDAWLDKPGTRHRLVVDTTSAAAAQDGMNYVATFYGTNESGYGLAADTLGVVLVLRHLSTPFGYNDGIWSKYGAVIVEKLKLSGHSAVRALHGNPLLSAANPGQAPVRGPGGHEAPTLAGLAAKGTRFAVCQAATAVFAQMLTEAGGTAAAIEEELKANLIPGAVLMASGIVAVNRAQEHGYTLVAVAG